MLSPAKTKTAVPIILQLEKFLKGKKQGGKGVNISFSNF
jgi:hypothetical protein